MNYNCEPLFNRRPWLFPVLILGAFLLGNLLNIRLWPMLVIAGLAGAIAGGIYVRRHYRIMVHLTRK